MAGIQVSIGDPLAVRILHAQYGETIKRPSHELVTVYPRNTRRATMIMILGIRLRVPVARVLDFVCGRIPTRIIQRVIQGNARERKADHAHGQTMRLPGKLRCCRNSEIKLLGLDTIWIRVVLIHCISW